MKNKRQTAIAIMLYLSVAFILHPAISYTQGYERTYPMPGNQLGHNIRTDQNKLFAVCINNGFFATAKINPIGGDLISWQPQIASNAYSGISIWGSEKSIITAQKFTMTQYNHDVILAKYDSLNNQVWMHQYGDTLDEWPAIISENIDKSIYTLIELWGENTLRLMKVDSAGNLMWTHDYPNIGSLRSMIATNDGGCLMNIIPYFLSPPRDHLIKVSPAGNIEWQRDGMLAGNISPQKMIQTSDSNLIMVATRPSAGGYRSWDYISKYTLSGDSIWQYKLIDGDTTKAGYSSISDIVESRDGGIIITGIYNPSISTAKAFIAKLTSEGDSVWVRLLNENIIPGDIEESAGGNLYIFGYYYSSNETDLWLLMTDSTGQYSDDFLSGKIFYDNDSSCLYTSGEMALRNWMVKADGSLADHYATADINGDYDMQMQMDTYTVNVYPPSPYWDPCIANANIVFDLPVQHDTLNIGIKPIVYCPWLEVSIGGYCRIRPGDDAVYCIQYCNQGTAMAYNSRLDVMLPPEIIFINATIPYVHYGQVVSFNPGNIDIGDCGNFVLYCTVSIAAALGNMMCATAHITPDSICLPNYTGYIPSRDFIETLVVASLDPNEKTGNPFGEGPQHIINANTRLSYIINFQNTGTDTAFKVIIIDTLPSQLDVTTFKAGASTHNYDYEIFNNGTVKFTFYPITLPDSITDPYNSKGFVKFSIDQKTDLPIGTRIRNYASIYFDFNEAVQTEPWIYAIGEPFHVETPLLIAKLNIYPNPATDYVNIGTGEYSEIEILSIEGQIIKTINCQSKETSIEIGNFPSGVYLVKAKTDKEIIVKKFIKQ